MEERRKRMEKVMERILGKEARMKKVRERKREEGGIVMIVEMMEEKDAKELVRRG